jgi:putative hydrolase of the HAD superfamily
MENLTALQTGKLTAEEFVYMFSRKLGRPVPGNIWEMFFKPEPIKDTIEIIEQLRREHRVIAGTNTIEPHFKVHKSRGDYNVFDKVYASHIIGFAKPDRESCRPEETFFTDDTAINVDAAARIGMNAFHFTESSILREKLREYL